VNGSGRSGFIARRQVVEQSIALVGAYFSAPSGHLGHFAIPLRAGEALLAHHMIVVAYQAGGFVAVRFGLLPGFGRRGSWGRWCLGYGDGPRLRGVVQVTVGIPLGFERLGLTGLIGGARHQRVLACIGFPGVGEFAETVFCAVAG